ncbi:MAG: hypothetical protein D8M57_05480 [Candidatus Scalindua sp. AMX11]|nr:MAG: hypothetical protein DWQ00_07305 [Candidatus Scalindua sp.]TDE65989.1 MAG: hypothetical protein D8M57_05480 [Candidatus Scalindua sp. AMX11]
MVKVSPDWKTPMTFPGQKPRTLLGHNSFRKKSENYCVMDRKEKLRIQESRSGPDPFIVCTRQKETRMVYLFY